MDISELNKKYEALLKDFKEFILNPDDACKYCKHNQPCEGEKCKFYTKGIGLEDLKGYKYDWQWTCEDFRFGECPKLEGTPCNGCIENGYSRFEYKEE